jgi:hypothetical protein
VLLGTRLTRFLIVHPFGLLYLTAPLTPAMGRHADFTGDDDQALDLHT